MPRIFPADKREGEGFIVLMYTPEHKLMSYDILLGCFSSRLCVASACHCGACTGSPCMQSPNDLSDLFLPAFVNSQMVQADSLAILWPVFPVRSLRMPASALS